MSIKNIKKNQEMQISVKRAKEFKSGDVGFDMVVNGVTIYGCVFKVTDRGNFVSFPAKKNESDGKYYNHVYFKIDEDMLHNIEEQICNFI